MDIIAFVAIALGLSIDAFAVSLTNSVVIKGLELKYGLRMAVFFGLFQMVMPVIGWAAGSTFARYITGFDHWIAFGLLAFIGGRMLWMAIAEIREERRIARNGEAASTEVGCTDGDGKDCRHVPTLLMLSIATSIDALAVGLSFAFIQVSIILPVILIGVITFVVCLAAYFIGTRLGHHIKFKLELVGGLVLIGIGLKILIEHLFGA